MEGFSGEFLWELEIVKKQLLALAETMPADKYGWRPEEKVRSVSEVLVHVAAGNFLLLDIVGATAPEDVYGQITAGGFERFVQLIRKNDDLEKSLREKDAVIRLLRQSFQAVAKSFAEAGAAELDRRLHFAGEITSVRRVYLRMLAHSHEHMGQMIAYLRCNGIAPPWPDWRPDRRVQD
jgi:uncharacterized damage-inducible protein DinB